jgi:hypothetical protein
VFGAARRLLLGHDVVDRVAAGVAVDLKDHGTFAAHVVRDPDRQVSLVVRRAQPPDADGEVGILCPLRAEVGLADALAVDGEATHGTHVPRGAEVLHLGLGAVHRFDLLLPAELVRERAVAVDGRGEGAGHVRVVRDGRGDLPVLVDVAVAVVVDVVDAGVELDGVRVDGRVGVVAVDLVGEAVGVGVHRHILGARGVVVVTAAGVVGAVIVVAGATSVVGAVIVVAGVAGVCRVVVVAGVGVAGVVSRIIVVTAVGVAGVRLTGRGQLVAVAVDAVADDLFGVGVDAVVLVIAVEVVVDHARERGACHLGLGVVVAEAVVVQVRPLLGGLEVFVDLPVAVVVDVVADLFGVRVDPVAVDATVAILVEGAVVAVDFAGEAVLVQVFVDDVVAGVEGVQGSLFEGQAVAIVGVVRRHLLGVVGAVVAVDGVDDLGAGTASDQQHGGQEGQGGGETHQCLLVLDRGEETSQLRSMRGPREASNWQKPPRCGGWSKSVGGMFKSIEHNSHQL